MESGRAACVENQRPATVEPKCQGRVLARERVLLI